jgi:hypothetical protein
MDSNGPNNYLFERFPTQIIAFVVIEFSYYDFHATFDRGLKVRLFCSPQCLFGLPKSSFGEHKISMVRRPNRVLTPLKSASKIRISSFVHPSKIFVWIIFCSSFQNLLLGGINFAG